MLNISRNRIKGKVNLDTYESYRWVMQEDFKSLPRVLLGLFGLMVALLFLPWTQNIQSRGFITTLNPSQRPQMVNTVIPGKIDKWYIREGQFVNKGDTLVKLTEIKDDYLDPALLSRTEEQIEAKERTVRSYQDKVQALDAQIIALENARKLKLEQARNYVMQAQLKVESDSMDVLAAETNFLIAQRQLERTETLFAEGLKSVVEVENLKNKTQEAASKKISAENKLLSSRNQLINAQIDLSGIEAEYRDKLAKAESDKYSAISALYEGEGTLVKMRNMFSNYSLRADLYYILAPQSGYVVRMAKAGIGEVIKESEQLVSIIPEDYTMAVEMFVEPIDLPLVKIGQPVRFVFDGWPAIVFSGWPNTSFGTYGGRVVAVDNFIYPNGKYRLLVSPDPQDVPWPRELRMGTGAKGMALLNDVPIWYEFWRRINGFPPEYYYGVSSTESESKEDKK